MQRHDIDRHETGANTTDSFTKSFICPPELSVGIKNQILKVKIIRILTKIIY